MVIGLLHIHLHIHDSQSLKEKRMVVKSLKDRLRRQFNVLSGVVKFIEDVKEVEILRYEMEML